MGKKKKSSSPKRWGIKRSARLQSAKNWLSNYNGKNVVKSYRKHFHVDIVCAINELEILGISFSESYKKSVNTSIESKIKQKKERKEKKEEENEQEKLSDEYFAFIAGYTSGGFPYGITWDEIEQ